ncbi:MAG TPA: AbrB/MazE/SpoVT family DNA-binding domain-containing protein [Gemmatimonadota bacterium]|nr:AbrB/MazE/SpoVT family DNA-binding domain-containing protein [Gemmatimonadota bacterium]
MAVVKVTSKGQVTIPKSVRERLGVRSGDYLRFVVREDGTACIEALRGGA